MYFSASTSGLVHIVIVAASLGTLPAIELAFGDRFGRGATRDVLSYEESNEFQSKFSTGALTDEPGETIEDENASGIDPDDNVDSLTSGDFGFDEVGESSQTDSRAGDPTAQRPISQEAGGAGRGEDQAKEASLDGELEEAGDTGEAEDEGQATREIVIFVNLRPEPEPDQETVEADPARQAGPTDIPAAIAAETTGDALAQLAALDQSEPEVAPQTERAGDPDAPEDGETAEGRKSIIDPTKATAPEIGEISESGGTQAAKAEIEGGLPETLPTGDENALAPTRTTAAIIQSETPTGVAEASEETTAVQAATGQPGLPDAGPDVTPTNEPIPEDIEAQAKRTVAVPLKGVRGAQTPAPRIQDHQQLREPEQAGTSLARIGSRLAGVEEQEDGLIGQNADIPQDQVKVAEGLQEAPLLARKADEVRDGAPESVLERAEESDTADLSGTQIAAVQPGEAF